MERVYVHQPQLLGHSVGWGGTWKNTGLVWEKQGTEMLFGCLSGVVKLPKRQLCLERSVIEALQVKSI